MMLIVVDVGGGGSSGRKHASRSASNDSLLDAADEDLSPDHRLPNKDFRKSDLNRARYYEPESDVFERDPSPEVRRPRGHRRNDSYGKDAQVGARPFQVAIDHPRLLQTLPGCYRPSQVAIDPPRLLQTLPGCYRPSQVAIDPPRLL